MNSHTEEFPLLTFGFHRKYTFLQILSKGDHSCIILCKEKHSNKLFVAKIHEIIDNYNHNDSDSDNEDQLKMNAETEYNVMKMCADQPNIISAHNYYKTDSYICIIMDYCPDGDLCTFLENNLIPEESLTRSIMKQLLEAIAFLHEHNWIHADIKLENILLDDNRNIKLIDFELSLYMKDLTRRRYIRGSPLYFSPEMAERICNKADTLIGPKSDVWCAGVIMFYLVVGYMPFDHDDVDEDDEAFVDAITDMCEDIRLGHFSIIEEYWENIPTVTTDLIFKMLAIDCSARLTAQEALAHNYFK